MGKSGNHPPEKKKVKWFFEERDDEEVCPLCQGLGIESTGTSDGEYEDCGRCEGTGVIYIGEK